MERATNNDGAVSERVAAGSEPDFNRGEVVEESRFERPWILGS
jgi:hypothetical protein